MSLADQTIDQPSKDKPLFIPASQIDFEKNGETIWKNGELIE